MGLTAILGGLGAAAAWAISTLCSSRSSRMIDPRSVVAWVTFLGLLITAPLAAADGVPSNLHGVTIVWLTLSGAGNVGGLLLSYRALRFGQVAIVAPVVSSEGAIAAVIATAAGETLGVGAALSLAIIVVGVYLASVPAPRVPNLREATRPATVLLAIAAACSFGLSLYATGRASVLPSAWVVLSARVIGTIVLFIPFAVARRLQLTIKALPLVVASGVCEVLGFYSYTAGSRGAIAIAAVLASQFATFAAIGGYVLFGERLSRVQLAGVIAVIVGVALLTALTA